MYILDRVFFFFFNNVPEYIHTLKLLNKIKHYWRKEISIKIQVSRIRIINSFKQKFKTHKYTQNWVKCLIYNKMLIYLVGKKTLAYGFLFAREWEKLSNNLFLITISAEHVNKSSKFCNKMKIAYESKI